MHRNWKSSLTTPSNLVAQLTQEYEEHIKAEELRLVQAEQQRMEQELQRINAAALLEEQRRNAEQQAQAEAERRRKEFDEKVAKDGQSWLHRLNAL